MNCTSSWILAPLATGLLAADLWAQKIVWRIPERGVVFYERERDLSPSRVGGNAPPGFSFIMNPAVLLQGELDFSQKFMVDGPANLHELGAWLAFDLRRANKKGKFKRTIALMQPFGALHIAGTTSGLDKGGNQTIKARITRGDAVQGGIPDDVYQKYINHMNRQHLTATIEITRTIDVKRGLVTRFTSTLGGNASYNARPRANPFQNRLDTSGKMDFELTETWKLDRVAPNRYPEFPTQVAEAIDKGAQHIKGRVRNILAGGHSTPAGGPGRSFDVGTLALALLTLVKAGGDLKDPVIKDGFDDLRRRVVRDTYSLAVAIMAFEALHAPPNERQSLIEGRIQGPVARKLAAADQKLVEAWTAEILTHTDREIPNPDYNRRFSYTKNPNAYDNSNSQYALLGLYSAHLCGVQLSSQIWLACGNHWLEDQYATKAPAVPLVLVSHQDYAKMRRAPTKGRGRRRTVTRAKRTPSKGWPYMATKPRNNPQGGENPRAQTLTGSMTSAGITALTICEAVLRDGNKKKLRKERAQMRAAVNAGYAWMFNNFSVRKNKHGHGFHFYYLYGLERACELGQVALIGHRDWYFEGSIMLLGMQNGRGVFGGAALPGNCFAVLFLKQAAPPLPVITGKR